MDSFISGLHNHALWYVMIILNTKAITHWRITVIIIGQSEIGFPSAELSYKVLHI